MRGQVKFYHTQKEGWEGLAILKNGGHKKFHPFKKRAQKVLNAIFFPFL